MKLILPIALTLVAGSSLADEKRQLDAHEHGVGELNIAVDGNTVAIELYAPGADIVGFEYAAESEEDRAAIETAMATLARPLDLFQISSAAECTVTQASAELESEEEHAEHAEGEHDHGDHAEHAEGEHGHDEHAHDEHGHDEHEAHAEAEGASHTEFHAEYVLNCANPDAISEITFGYFDAFENARELEVQLVTGSGAQAFEVERDAPVLDMRGML